MCKCMRAERVKLKVKDDLIALPNAREEKVKMVERDFGHLYIELVFVVGNFQRPEEVDQRQMALHVPVAEDFDVSRQIEPIHLKKEEKKVSD